MQLKPFWKHGGGIDVTPKQGIHDCNILQLLSKLSNVIVYEMFTCQSYNFMHDYNYVIMITIT